MSVRRARTGRAALATTKPAPGDACHPSTAKRRDRIAALLLECESHHPIKVRNAAIKQLLKLKVTPESFPPYSEFPKDRRDEKARWDALTVDEQATELLREPLPLAKDLKRAQGYYDSKYLMVQDLLDARGFRDNGRRSKDPPLVVKAREGSLALVEALLNAGTPIDECLQWTEEQDKFGMYTKSWDWDGDTALIAAAREGHQEIVQLLLDRGAKPTARCCYEEDRHETAEEAARRFKHDSIADLIRDSVPVYEERKKKAAAHETVSRKRKKMMNPREQDEVIKVPGKRPRKVLQQTVENFFKSDEGDKHVKGE